MSHYTFALRTTVSDCLCKQISFLNAKASTGIILFINSDSDCEIFNDKMPDQIRGSQAEKSSFQPKLILRRCDGAFQLAIRAGLLYVSDPHTLPLVLRCMRVMCATEHVHVCGVMRFYLFLTHCAAVVWEIASVYTFTVLIVEQIRINIIMINKTAMKTKWIIFLLTNIFTVNRLQIHGIL